MVQLGEWVWSGSLRHLQPGLWPRHVAGKNPITIANIGLVAIIFIAMQAPFALGGLWG